MEVSQQPWCRFPCIEFLSRLPSAFPAVPPAGAVAGARGRGTVTTIPQQIGPQTPLASFIYCVQITHEIMKYCVTYCVITLFPIHAFSPGERGLQWLCERPKKVGYWSTCHFALGVIQGAMLVPDVFPVTLRDPRTIVPQYGPDLWLRVFQWSWRPCIICGVFSRH